MPIRKFRGIEEMGGPIWYEPGDPALYRAIRNVWGPLHIASCNCDSLLVCTSTDRPRGWMSAAGSGTTPTSRPTTSVASARCNPAADDTLA
jgi:hypothetical protein